MAVARPALWRSADRLLSLLAALSPIGVVGLLLTGLLGFEEPSTRLLLVSFALAIAAPVTVVIHLALTRELTPADRRIWMCELLSVRAGSAFAEYVSADDRSAAAKRREHEAAARAGHSTSL